MRTLLLAVAIATSPLSIVATAIAGPTTQPVASMAGQPASAPDLTAELNKLKDHWIKKLGGDGFAGVVHSPFAIVTDGDASASASSNVEIEPASCAGDLRNLRRAGTL